MKVRDITSYLDRVVPLSYQENYDNSGLQTGDPEADINSALISFDITGEVLDEAISAGCGLIITHHPLIFSPLKRIVGRTFQERILIKAIRNNISIYSAHTNLDVFENGVSKKMAEKLSLEKVQVLSPVKGKLYKLVTFIPENNLEEVRNAVFMAGAGAIGKYDQCSFNAGGLGTFRAGEDTSPFSGQPGKFHKEKEVRFETIFISHLMNDVLEALIRSHPYEEVAYDIYELKNDYMAAGLGCAGELHEPMKGEDFLRLLSETFGSRGVRYSSLPGHPVRKVGLCGGAGISLLNEAFGAGCDAYVTGDVKYHDFFNADGRLLLVDIGHYESEKFSTEILYDLIIKKFPTFALRFSETNTNPINYL